ncbi:biotin/lipoate A/B protein ligase family protein [Sulfuriferula sp. GW1]|uniref:lipoate--protein ligase family protein n=1 Tax=Sulfuriferula sp. GW1 TaxID=3345111 RepID=UPI0039B12469
MQPGDLPAVVWGRPQPHICLGQHQSASVELNAAYSDVPIVRRPLGGGSVWVDTDQACVALVAPLEFFPFRSADWYAHALQPMVQVYHEAGLPVTLAAQDIWLHGSKLAGSGAATIGRAGVLGSSFMLGFPIEQFAGRVASPSDGFRQWLIEALRTSLTSWSQHASVPDWEWLSMVYRRAANNQFGWRWEQSLLREDERAASDEWRTELIPDHQGSVRMVPHGIKINAACYLTERQYDTGWVRVLTQERRVVRVALSVAPGLPETLLASEPDSIAAELATYLDSAAAQLWAQRITETAYFNPEAI